MSCLVNCGQQVGDRRAERGTAANKGIQTWGRHRQGTREENKEKPHIQEGQRREEQSDKETGQTVSKERDAPADKETREGMGNVREDPKQGYSLKAKVRVAQASQETQCWSGPDPHQTRQQVRGQRAWDGSPQPHHIPSSPWAPALAMPGQAQETHQASEYIGNKLDL